jgi:hypothetical protein
MTPAATQSLAELMAAARDHFKHAAEACEQAIDLKPGVLTRAELLDSAERIGANGCNFAGDARNLEERSEREANPPGWTPLEMTAGKERTP